jgi:hypothetical protein
MNRTVQTIALAATMTISSLTCTSSYSVSIRVRPSYHAGKSKIVGFVSDAETGEPLPGASILIEGTNLEAGTDLEGYYQIKNVPAGEHQIQVLFIGFQSVRHYKLRVEPDKLIQLDFDLKVAVVQIYEHSIRQ